MASLGRALGVVQVTAPAIKRQREGARLPLLPGDADTMNRLPHAEASAWKEIQGLSEAKRRARAQAEAVPDCLSQPLRWGYHTGTLLKVVAKTPGFS